MADSEGTGVGGDLGRVYPGRGEEKEKYKGEAVVASLKASP